MIIIHAKFRALLAKLCDLWPET